MAISREDEIRRRYKAELADLYRQQSSCCHIWDEAKYDPEIKKEPYGCRCVGQGSDIWLEPAGYHDVSYSRWSRTCKKCGKVEYTTKQRTVKTEPDFS